MMWVVTAMFTVGALGFLGMLIQAIDMAHDSYRIASRLSAYCGIGAISVVVLLFSFAAASFGKAAWDGNDWLTSDKTHVEREVQP